MDAPYLDTSVLAKWYLNEPFSDAVDHYLLTVPYAWISSLTTLELRCLLARRRRSEEISPAMEAKVLALFEQDIAAGYLQLMVFEQGHLERASRIVATLPEQPLRSLDALHLAMLDDKNIRALATADRTMAAAAEALGVAVRKFLPEQKST